MDGDRLPNGTRQATVADTFGPPVTDSDEFAGVTRETQTFNGDGGREITASVTTPTSVAVTATRARAGLPDQVARIMATKDTTTYTDLAAGGTRQVRSSHEYDSVGRQIHETESGSDVADLCTTTRYADNQSTWIRDLVSETIKSAQSCPTGQTAPTNIVSDTRTHYDTPTLTDTPTALGLVPGPGDATNIDTLTTTTPQNHWATTRVAYDALGRPTTTSVDVSAYQSRTTTTAYTPATSGPTTRIVITDPAGLAATTVIDPSRGLSTTKTDKTGLTTSATYDPLGRITAVWRPGQVQGTNPASVTYSYAYGPTAPLATTTKTLVDPGNGATPGYTTSVSIYDAFGQLRQTQSQAVGGGRNVADQYHDSHGWTYLTNNRWHTTGDPSATLITTAQSGIQDSVQNTYDGTGRVTKSTEYNGTTATWFGTTHYSGDSTTVVPPAGGVETTTRTDARGAIAEVDQWTTAPTISTTDVLTDGTGTATKTEYTRDVEGQQTAVITAAGTPDAATWTYGYDLAGQIVDQTDPDTGHTHNVYDDAGDLVSTANAISNANNGAGTLLYTYDASGNKIGEYHDTITSANQLASWTFDATTGRPTGSTSFTSDGNYSQKITGYTTAGDPKGTEVDLPAGDVTAGFADHYTTSTTWTTTHLAATTVPAAGGSLPSETIHHYYDALGDPTGTTGYNAYVSTSTYTPYGEPAQYTLGANNQTTWLTMTRDAQTRRTVGLNLSAQIGTPQLEDFSYTYDPSGNLTRSVDTEGAAGTATQTTCYDYNALNQLTAAWSASDACQADVNVTGDDSTVKGPQPFWTSWTVNAVSGREKQIRHGLDGQGDSETDYAIGTNGHNHALTGATTSVGSTVTSRSAYQYDANGSVTGKTVTPTTGAATAQTFDYNLEGRVSAIHAGERAVSFSYDADGTEVLRRDPDSVTLFLPGEELKLDRATKIIVGTRYYTHNGTTVALRVANAAPTWELQDTQGTASTFVPTNSAGDLTPIRQHTDPYGNPLGNGDGSFISPAGASRPDAHGFLNKSEDDETGLDELGARLYEPTTGRFLESDPVLDVSDPQSTDGYTYADANPITKSDPGGTDVPGPCSQYDNRRCYPGDPWYTGGDTDSSGGTATSSGGANTAAGSSGGGAGSDFDRTTRHNQAQYKAIVIIKEQAAAMHVKGQIITNWRISGASKACMGGGGPVGCSYGVPDIVFRTSTGVNFIWEVKSVSEAAKAQPEAEWYVDRARVNGDKAAVGWSIGGPYTVGNGDVDPVVVVGSGRKGL